MAYFEGHRMLLFAPFADTLSSSNSVSCQIVGQSRSSGLSLPAPE